MAAPPVGLHTMEPMTAVSDVPVSVRLRLGHACLQHLADRAPARHTDGSGARILHVKGVALHPLLAEGRGASSDCDVLVHPEDVAAFTRSLIAHGWELMTRFEHGSVFAHAATYYHRVWGTVDVHRSFPGLERDAAGAFDRMWETREIRELGGAACATPDLLAQRLLLLIHAARDAMGRAEGDRAAAWDRAPSHERDQLDALADELGATVPLALATGRPQRALGHPGEHTWTAVHAGADPTQVWRARVRDARGRARLGVLLSALRVNPDHLALRLGHRPDAGELRTEWWARWGRAARSVRRRAAGPRG